MAKPRHDYSSKDPYTCYDNIHHYRKNFIYGDGQNKAELRVATDAAIEMKLWDSTLPDVPMPDDLECPTEQDFLNIEIWFVNVHKSLSELSKELFAENNQPEPLKPEDNTPGNISGMRWQDVQEKAERIVEKFGWQGFDKLRIAVGGCSKNTLRKAVDNSGKLKETEAQYKSMSGTLKAIGLTSKTLAIYGKSSEEKLPSETETNEILDELLRQTKKEKPKMLEETKKQLDKMDSESRQKLASAYKNITLGEDPKKPHQYKEV